MVQLVRALIGLRSRLRHAVGWLVALTAFAAHAQSPIDAVPWRTAPQAWTVRGGLTALGESTGPRAAALLDVAVGFPWKLYARARVAVFSDTSGGVSAAVGLNGGFGLGPFHFGGRIEVEGVAPAWGAGVDSSLLSPQWAAHGNLLFSFGLEHTGLAFVLIGRAELHAPVTARLQWISSAGYVAEAGLRRYPDGHLSGVAELDTPLRLNGTRLLAFLELDLQGRGPLAGGLSLNVAFDVSRRRAPVEASPHTAGDVADLKVDAHVALNELAVPGKATVLELGATWCGPCRELQPQLLELAARRPDLALRLIDVDQSAAFASAVGNTTIPDVILFDAKGRVLARGHLSVADIEAALPPP